MYKNVLCLLAALLISAMSVPSFAGTEVSGGTPPPCLGLAANTAKLMAKNNYRTATFESVTNKYLGIKDGFIFWDVILQNATNRRNFQYSVVAYINPKDKTCLIKQITEN